MTRQKTGSRAGRKPGWHPGPEALANFRATLADPENFCRFTRERCPEAKWCLYSLAEIKGAAGEAIVAKSKADVCRVAIAKGVECRQCEKGKAGQCEFPAACFVRAYRRRRPQC